MPRRKHKDMPRVKQFVHEYVWGKHAGQVMRSAQAAGFGKGKITEIAEQSACNYGHQLLRRKEIAEQVAKEQAEKKALFKSKALRVAEEVYLQATADIGDVFKDGKLLDTEKMPEDARRAVQSIEVEERTDGRGEDAETYYLHKIKLVDKKASQELFLKWAGELSDKVDHNHSGTITVVDPYAEAKK